MQSQLLCLLVHESSCGVSVALFFEGNTLVHEVLSSLLEQSSVSVWNSGSFSLAERQSKSLASQWPWVRGSLWAVIATQAQQGSAARRWSPSKPCSGLSAVTAKAVEVLLSAGGSLGPPMQLFFLWASSGKPFPFEPSLALNVWESSGAFLFKPVSVWEYQGRCDTLNSHNRFGKTIKLPFYPSLS